MHKKEVVFLLLTLVLLTGCLQQQKTSESQQAPTNNELLTEFQKKYYNLNDEEIEKIRTAIETLNEKECQKITELYEISSENILLERKCFSLITKLKAFLERDYELCKPLYLENNPENYEECTAPIIAISAKSLKDPTYCKKYLTIQRLITICEKEYES